MRTWPTAFLPLGSLVVSLAFACGQVRDDVVTPRPEGRSSEQEPAIESEQRIDDSSGSPTAPLPSMGTLSDGYPPPAPDLCTWAASVDAIVWGYLTDVRFADTPAIEYTNDYTNGAPGWQWAATCQWGSDPTLVLEVEVLRMLRGSLGAGQTFVQAPKIVVYTGYEYMSSLSPMPYRDTDGSLAWTASLYGGQALQNGQLIGFALHYLPDHDKWSIMGEAMFAADGSGNIIFQERRPSGDLYPPPVGADGLTVDELANAVAACVASSESTARRDWVRAVWGSRPGDYVAAWCYPEVWD